MGLGPALDAIRRGLQAGTWLDAGAVSNAVSAALLVVLAVSRRERYHVGVTLIVASLFLWFIVSAALSLG